MRYVEQSVSAWQNLPFQSCLCVHSLLANALIGRYDLHTGSLWEIFFEKCSLRAIRLIANGDVQCVRLSSEFRYINIKKLENLNLSRI